MVVGLMIFALSGLIAFQVYWINNALELSKTQFIRNVQESLVEVAGQLEKQEAMDLTRNTMVYFSQESERNGQKESSARVWVNSAPPGSGVRYRFESDSVIFMTRPNGKKTEERIRNKVELLDVAVHRIFTRGDLDITKRLSAQKIDSLLQNAFNEKGISTAFSYGVIENGKSGSRKVVLASSRESDGEVLTSEFRASLFPNDIQGSDHFLAVYFPNQSAYVLKQIGMTLFASIVFIVIILGSFIYTMRVIGKQKKLSQIKSDFINNMTHEFKTPIATISLATQVLAESGMQENSEARNKYISVIRDENERLARHVERVLESSLLENNEIILDRERTSIHHLLDDCMKTFHSVNSEFEFNAHFNAVNDMVNADVHHMINVMNNLLDNAVKYSAESREVVVETTNEKDQVRISVKDFGIGMEANRIKHIFDHFYRIPTGNLHDVKGFGLGLSYVKRLIDMHGGDISVRSAPGKGSEFIITLPNAS